MDVNNRNYQRTVRALGPAGALLLLASWAAAGTPARPARLRFREVLVNPAAITLAPGSSQVFSCSVLATGATSCGWSVAEGAAGGGVTSGGVYTAPASTGTYHVIATSLTDGTKFGTAAVLVAAASGGGNPNPSAGCGQNGVTGDQLLSINVGGTMRTFQLSVPANYANTTPEPLYFVFHGAGGNHQSMTVYGIQDNVIAVFPDGVGGRWDTKLNGTDVAMFDAILSMVTAGYCVDRNRVYATGFSFGASMTNALGCARSDVLRAIAPVDGGILFSTTTVTGASACKGPIPAWINHFQQDPTVPFQDGLDTVALFSALNGDSNPQPYDAPNPCVMYTGNEPLVFCTPPQPWHAWPDFATAAIKRFFGGL